MFKGLIILLQAALISAASASPVGPSVPLRHVPVVPFDRTASQYSVPLDSIVRIQCGDALGTAEVVAGNLLITASHVVGREKLCRFTDDDTVAVVVSDRPDLDYAVLRASTASRATIPVDCGGFITGDFYLMIGYAHGRDFAVQIVQASAEFSNLQDRLTGSPFWHVRTLAGKPAIPGMSGGPIFNMRGAMVGTTLAAPTDPKMPFGFARELADTPACQK